MKDAKQLNYSPPLSIRYIRGKNIMLIKGRSTRLDVITAYHRLIKRIKKHFSNADSLYCYFNYEVINASTTKLLFNLFRELEQHSKIGKKIIIHWVVGENDLDLLEIGNDLKSFFQLDFRVNPM